MKECYWIDKYIYKKVINIFSSPIQSLVEVVSAFRLRKKKEKKILIFLRLEWNSWDLQQTTTSTEAATKSQVKKSDRHRKKS